MEVCNMRNIMGPRSRVLGGRWEGVSEYRVLWGRGEGRERGGEGAHIHKQHCLVAYATHSHSSERS